MSDPYKKITEEYSEILTMILNDDTDSVELAKRFKDYSLMYHDLMIQNLKEIREGLLKAIK